MGDDGHFHVGMHTVNQEDLERAGIQTPEAVNLPTIDQVTLDDDDSGGCYYVNKTDIRDLYLDNPVHAGAVQVDVWTLEGLDDQYLTFTYSNGAQYTIQVGQINMGAGAGATRYRKSGGIVYPTDDAGTVLINSVTTPRLAAVRYYLQDEVRKISEERLEMAELVNSFAKIIAMTSGLDGIK